MNKAMVKGENGKFEDRSIEVLHDAVVECCGAWGLYEQTDFITQQVKGCEEAGEGCKSVNKGLIEALKDDVGDMLVCIINMCQIYGSNFINEWRESQSAIVNWKESKKKHQMRELVHEMSSDYIEFSIALGLIKGLCELHEIDPVECLGIAYDVISKRTGKMYNGTWIKDGD